MVYTLYWYLPDDDLPCILNHGDTFSSLLLEYDSCLLRNTCIGQRVHHTII